MPDDLSSLAYSLIPGALGTAIGGPGLGLAGLAGGIGAIDQDRIEREKLNAEIDYRNQTLQQNYQKMRLEEEQQQYTKTHYDYLNKAIDDTMKTSVLTRRKMKQDLDYASQDRGYLQSLSDKIRAQGHDDLATQLLVDPKEGLKRMGEEFFNQQDITDNANILRAIGPKNTPGLNYEALATTLGRTGMKQFLINERDNAAKLQEAGMRLAAERSNPYNIVKMDDGNFLKYNRGSGAFEVLDQQKLGLNDPNVSLRNKQNAMNGARQVYATQFKGREATAPAFEDWINPKMYPVNNFNLLASMGSIPAKDYPDMQKAAYDRETAIRDGALDKMKQAYWNANKMVPGTPQAEAAFQAYYTKPDTGAPGILDNYILTERGNAARGWGTATQGQQAPAASSAGGARRPAQLTPDQISRMSPDERANYIRNYRP